MKKLKVLDLFSGIGGFSLGLERAGMETIAFCEIEKFPRKVLAKHWPDVLIYEDVRNVTKERLDADGIYPDVICGGFPCQDISVAGKQEGINGERSGLWSELCRIISEVRPSYAIVENVTALITGEQGGWFHTVLGNLAESGYGCEWHCIPASEIGANHHRDRVWIICYPEYAKLPASETRESNKTGDKEISEIRNTGCENDIPYADMQRQKQAKKTYDNVHDGQKPTYKFTRGLHKLLREQKINKQESSAFGLLDSVKPTICRNAHGIPYRVDRIKGLGNAVVPQIPEIIGRAIIEIK